ncbi:glycerol-3-phosphate 1-O-acyltransferase PlsY [Pseudomonas sp. 102515]|uniref:glycerol-3-phosphate 1-O-acyltransferase PlsY n=1 Tax=Pseudomonas sp. 102515 TaxID=3071568 RepID=UPI0028014DF9|nr:glycerol-3-phosphate 1-O-acyltransferase PlsY [Pseudomonas sp. 102515]MDQ7914480.1 glycerol-3-phosphate 1-O-acyltransferase PlsY [Pseudomonas sp. 102515]
MFWLLLLLAYLLGSLSFAVLLSRLFGTRDPRHDGSGNPGASNMLRLAGRKLALLTLAGDLSKSLIPVLIAQHLGLSPLQQAWIGLAAVVGHLYPLYFHFRGGKGVATAAGLLLGLYPPAALLGLVLWAVVFASLRIASLASLVAVLGILPLFAWQRPDLLPPMLLLALLILIRHRHNLRALRQGTERHF